MVDMEEQCVCIKFYFKLGQSAAKTHKMLKQAFGDDALGQKQTNNWFNQFKNGQLSVDDEGRSGQSSIGTMPENVAKECEVICKGHRRMIHDVCNTVELSCGHTRAFWRTNSTWGRLQQNSCQDCWLTIRSNISCKSPQNLRSRSETTHTSFPRLKLVMKVVFMGTNLKQHSNYPVKVSIFTPVQESMQVKAM